MNADAAALVGSALAERCSELIDEPADRIELRRMVAPIQHDASSCGLTALCFLYQIYLDHVQHKCTQRSSALKTPSGVSEQTWKDVEKLRRAAALIWAPAVVVEVDAYWDELSASARPTKLCSQHCEVVFDLHEDDEVPLPTQLCDALSFLLAYSSGRASGCFS